MEHKNKRKLIQKDCLICKKNKIDSFWYKDNTCSVCYKKNWRHKNNKTVYKTEYKPEFDRYVDSVKQMVSDGLNMSHIKKNLKIHSAILLAIAKKHNIQLVKAFSPNRIKKEAEFLEKLKSGLPVSKAALGLFNPKIAKEIALKYGYKTQTPSEIRNATTLPLSEALDRLNKNFVFIEKKGNLFHIQCLKCGLFFKKTASQLRRECKKCVAGQNNKTENSIKEWLKEFYPDFDKFYFPESRKEIDIYSPTLKIGIEYNGLKWHAENLKEGCENENKHYVKYLLAKKHNIRLINIFEDEWLERQTQVKNYLISVMGKNSIKIRASKCSVEQIEKKEANEFLEDTHIQGGDKSGKAFWGIFYEKTLLGAVSVGHHPRKGENTETLYLTRMSFSSNTTIYGGASKLFKAVVRWAKKQGFKQIITWSDNRWSEGLVYLKMGFVFDTQKNRGKNRGLLDGSIWPDFTYVYKKKRVSRSYAKKMKLDTSVLPKVYDCGKKRWIYRL